MSGTLAQRRRRIARVRHIQHLQAAAIAAKAEARVAQLESTAERLALLAASLAPVAGDTSGAAMRTAGGMAQRLSAMRDGMTDAVIGARAAAEHEGGLRLAARIRQESAERLGQRAATAAAADVERRLSHPRPRRLRAEDDAV